jgi:hypothetical protein
MDAPLPLLNGTATGWRSALLIESAFQYKTSTGTTVDITYQAIRTPQDIYAEYKTGEKELYNFADDACHAADPYQLASQHANPAIARRSVR